MKNPEPSVNHLPENFYTMPLYASAALTRAQLKETLLATNGWIMACGAVWNIESRHIGAGVYNVSLRRRP